MTSAVSHKRLKSNDQNGKNPTAHTQKKHKVIKFRLTYKNMVNIDIFSIQLYNSSDACKEARPIVTTAI